MARTMASLALTGISAAIIVGAAGLACSIWPISSGSEGALKGSVLVIIW
jgi:hypothetical protein